MVNQGGQVEWEGESSEADRRGADGEMGAKGSWVSMTRQVRG